MATNPYTGMNLVNTWDPQTGLYYDQSGQEVSGDEFYRQQFSTNLQSMGAKPLTAAEQQILNTQGSAGLSAPEGMGLYNAGNQMAWAPVGDSRFVPAPQHNDSFLSTWTPGNDATPEMHGGALVAIGGPLIGAAGTAIAAAGAGAGAGGVAGDAALAGGGEVGSGYAASAPGWGAAGNSAAAGAGTLGGTSEAGTLTGTSANDTLGSSTMDWWDNPSQGDWWDSGNVYANSGSATNTADPYGLGVDQYGNPTWQYANSTFQGGGADTTNYGQSPGLGLQDYYKYGQQGLSALNQYKGLLGGLGGALAGSLGGSKPAGTTTTTVGAPEWLQPYIQGNLGAAYNTLQGINPNNPLLGASQNEAMKTINGAYLDPSSNPYFANSVNDALGQAKSQYLGLYGGAAGTNVNNSGFQEGLSRGLGAAATNAYNTNYQTERGRQATMAAGAPQLVSQSNAAMFSPNQSFSGLIPGFTSTSVPYFQNNLGNMFSGALGGAALTGAMGK